MLCTECGSDVQIEAERKGERLLVYVCASELGLDASMSNADCGGVRSPFRGFGVCAREENERVGDFGQWSLIPYSFVAGRIRCNSSVERAEEGRMDGRSTGTKNKAWLS